MSTFSILRGGVGRESLPEHLWELRGANIGKSGSKLYREKANALNVRRVLLRYAQMIGAGADPSLITSMLHAYRHEDEQKAGLPTGSLGYAVPDAPVDPVGALRHYLAHRAIKLSEHPSPWLHNPDLSTHVHHNVPMVDQVHNWTPDNLRVVSVKSHDIPEDTTVHDNTADNGEYHLEHGGSVTKALKFKTVKEAFHSARQNGLNEGDAYCPTCGAIFEWGGETCNRCGSGDHPIEWHRDGDDDDDVPRGGVTLDEVKKALPSWTPSRKYKGDGGKTYSEYVLGSGRQGQFTIEHDPKLGYRMRNIYVSPELQRQGHASNGYRLANEQSLRDTGKPLRSSEVGYAKTSGNTTMSPEAEGVWKKLVGSGEAILSGNHYTFAKQAVQKGGVTLDEVKKATAVDLSVKPRLGATIDPLSRGDWTSRLERIPLEDALKLHTAALKSGTFDSSFKHGAFWILPGGEVVGHQHDLDQNNSLWNHANQVKKWSGVASLPGKDYPKHLLYESGFHDLGAVRLNTTKDFAGSGIAVATHGRPTKQQMQTLQSFIINSPSNLIRWEVNNPYYRHNVNHAIHGVHQYDGDTLDGFLEALGKYPVNPRALAINNVTSHAKQAVQKGGVTLDEVKKAIYPKIHPLETEAIRRFGLTNDPKKAGYILRDGSMLNFYDPSKDLYDENSKNILHDTVSTLPSFPKNHRNPENHFLTKTGAVRYSQDGGSITVVHSVHPLSSAQMSTISNHFPQWDQSLHTEVSHPDGITTTPIHNNMTEDATSSDVRRMLEIHNQQATGSAGHWITKSLPSTPNPLREHHDRVSSTLLHKYGGFEASEDAPHGSYWMNRRGLMLGPFHGRWGSNEGHHAQVFADAAHEAGVTGYESPRSAVMGATSPEIADAHRMGFMRMVIEPGGGYSFQHSQNHLTEPQKAAMRTLVRKPSLFGRTSPHYTDDVDVADPGAGFLTGNNLHFDHPGVSKALFQNKHDEISSDLLHRYGGFMAHENPPEGSYWMNRRGLLLGPFGGYQHYKNGGRHEPHSMVMTDALRTAGVPEFENEFSAEDTELAPANLEAHRHGFARVTLGTTFHGFQHDGNYATHAQIAGMRHLARGGNRIYVDNVDTSRGKWGVRRQEPIRGLNDVQKSLSTGFAIVITKSYPSRIHPLEQEAVNHYGLTNDPHLAGYILRDGRMLDFSGRHAGMSRADYDGIRQYDHSDVAQLPSMSRKGTFKTLPENEFMKHTGAVRFSHGGDGYTVINSIHPLSPQQMDRIRRYIPANKAHDILTEVSHPNLNQTAPVHSADVTVNGSIALQRALDEHNRHASQSAGHWVQKGLGNTYTIVKSYPPQTPSEPEIHYHGTPYADKVLSEGFKHRDTGEDQHGPGFYFTNNRGYAHGYTEPRTGQTATRLGVISAHLDIKKPIELTHPEHTGVNDWPALSRSHANAMIQHFGKTMSDDDLSDWGDVSYEGRGKVLRNMVDMYAGYSPASLIHDLHRVGNIPTEDALRHYSKLSGHDGVRVKYPDGVVHHVAWFPEQIHIQHMEPVDKELVQKSYVASLRRAESQTHQNPSPAQVEAENFRKGSFQWKGLTITIENPKGSIRRGKNPNKPWEVTMGCAYGYFNSQPLGRDGDPVDVFVNDENLDSDLVFVVNQVKPDGSFDEHKVIIGCNNEKQARKAYLSCYSKGWKGLGSIKALHLDDFKDWLKSGHRSVVKSVVFTKSVTPDPDYGNPSFRVSDEERQRIVNHFVDRVTNSKLHQIYKDYAKGSPKKVAIYTIGGPGSGKSFYAQNKFLVHPRFVSVDPDAIKEHLPGYDPKNPHLVHEESSRIGRMIQEEAHRRGHSYVYDGTGSDPESMKRKIQASKDAGYHVELHRAVVPMEVALKRNAERPRSIAPSVVVDLHNKIDNSFLQYKHLADRVRIFDTSLPSPTRIQIYRDNSRNV